MESQLTDQMCVYQQTQNNFFKKRGPVAIIIYLIFETSLQIFIPIYSKMMMKSLFICFLVILSGHIFIEAVECQQNTNIEDCGKIDKQEFDRKIQDYKPDYNIQNKIEQMFPADSNLLMDGLLNNDRSKIAEAIKGNEFKYILSIVPVSLFAILFVILPPLLLFTRCFSLLKCMKKRKQIQPYTKMQIRLPLMFTVIFCLGLVICCALVLNINRVYGTKYNDYKCSLNLIGDNLVSGVNYKHSEPLVTKNKMKLSESPSNYLQETSFLGTNKLKQMMNNFKMTLKDLYSVLRINLSPNSKYVGKLNRNLSKISDLILDMMSTFFGDKIPLIYQFAKPNNNGTIRYDSPFMDRFGSKYQNDSSLRSNFSNAIQNSKQSNFMISFQSERILKQIQEIQKEGLGQKINNLGQSAKSIENKIRQILNFTDKSSLWQFSVGSNVVLSFTIISVIIMSFSLIYMVFKNNHDCRIAVYICVLILWIIGLLHFAVAIGFTLSNPAVHHSCHNLYESFNSQYAYNKNILSRQPDSPDLISVGKCLTKSQTKDYLYRSIISNETQKKLKNFRKILSFNFDGGLDAKYINGNFSKLYSQVYNLRNGVTLDIDEHKPEINEIFKRATSVEQCAPDSWFLSVNENPVRFPCQLNAKVSTKTTCPSEQDFIARAPGCTGCMEMSSFISAYPTFIDFIHVMNKRYPNCPITQNLNYNYKTSSYVNRIIELYQSFMSPKSTYLTPILKVLNQMNPIQNQTVSLLKNLNQFQQSTKQLVLNQPFLQSTDKSILNNEMDCRVIGKAVDRSINILCSQAPSYVYNLRFLYLSTGLIILIICILTIFLVVRYEKHWEILRKKQIQNQFNENVEIENPINSSTRFNQVQQRIKQDISPSKEIKQKGKLKKEMINAMSLEQKYKYLKNRINATQNIKKSQTVQKNQLEPQIGQKQKQEIILQNNEEQNSQISSIQIQRIQQENQPEQHKQTTNI